MKAKREMIYRFRIRKDLTKKSELLKMGNLKIFNVTKRTKLFAKN